jgi:hypothetical protein
MEYWLRTHQHLPGIWSQLPDELQHYIMDPLLAQLTEQHLINGYKQREELIRWLSILDLCSGRLLNINKGLVKMPPLNHILHYMHYYCEESSIDIIIERVDKESTLIDKLVSKFSKNTHFKILNRALLIMIQCLNKMGIRTSASLYEIQECKYTGILRMSDDICMEVAKIKNLN